MRLFCGLRRISVRRALGALLYGIDPKFVPMPLPASALRNTPVISIKPTGVMYASPIFSESGEGAAASCGGSAYGEVFGVGTAGGGSIGVVEATTGIRGTALVSGAAAG